MSFLKKLVKKAGSAIKKVGGSVAKVVSKGAQIVGGLAQASNIPIVSNIGGVVAKGGSLLGKLLPDSSPLKTKVPTSAVVQKLVENPQVYGGGSLGDNTTQFASASGASFVSDGFGGVVGKIFGTDKKSGWFWAAVIGGPVLLITLLVLIFKPKKRR